MFSFFSWKKKSEDEFVVETSQVRELGGSRFTMRWFVGYIVCEKLVDVGACGAWVLDCRFWALKLSPFRTRWRTIPSFC